jgi:hypothetical protein
MLKISPDVVAKWVEVRADNLEMRPLRDVINDVLSAELRSNSRRSISDEEISETAEALVHKVTECLTQNADDYIKQGIDPPYTVDIADLFFKIRSSPETVLRKQLANMTPKGFEFFCRKILVNLMGSATVEGGPNDECVDFFAVGLPLAGAVGPFPTASRLAVIGQAKRWKVGSEVKLSDMREFVGGALIRADQLRKDYADRYGLLAPTSYAYWVTCDFSLGARQFANKAGLWYLNGIALSQLAIRTGLASTDIPTIEEEALKLEHT